MTVAVERDREVAVLRLERPPVNAMDLTLLGDLVAATAQVAASDARAVVLTGAGAALSAGVDLFALLDGGPDYVREFLPKLSEAFAKLFELPLPVVAAVNGHAIAGGCILVAACDHRVMAAGPGRIGVTELPVGVPFPAWPLEIMRFATPVRSLQEVILRGRTYLAEEAQVRGLIDEVAPPEDLLAIAMERARELAAIPAGTFAHTKAQLRRPTVERVARWGAQTDAAAEQLWTSPAVRAAIESYLARRVGGRRD